MQACVYTCYQRRVWSPREPTKRTNVLSVRLTDEELSAVSWLAEQLAAERGGHFLAVDAARIALGDYYERRKQEQGAVQKSPPAGRRKRS